MADKINIEKSRHSLSHVLAAAVLEMFPEAKLAIGPAIENGFYYDFDLPRTLIPEDLALLEKKMKSIIAGDYIFESRKEPKEKSIEFLKAAKQNYKVELVKGLGNMGRSFDSAQDDSGSNTVTFYDIKDAQSGKILFVDLCAGPHVGSTKDLRNIGWKLDKIAGAYWKGDEKNKMLQRIYGLAFESKQELNDFVKNRVEAEQRDHRNLGRELDLFSFHPESPGMPFWHEKGMIIWNILEALGKKIRRKHGYIEIKTPIMAKSSLFKTSGHWEHYKESMFCFDVEKETYCIKPMDCPFNIKIYQTKSRSYRDLPIRFTEIGHCYRNEKSGELAGLFRVREITQDDSHIFIAKEHVKAEIVNLIGMVKEYYGALTLKPEFFLATRPDDFIGEIKTWDGAEKDLIEALKSQKIDYQLKEKDGAFYGPKIDVNIKDVFGRSWQVATIQLDFQLPGRFGCEYTDESGKMKTPVLIHAAVFGSFERMIGILIEHFGGAFPAWLAPIQAIVLSITDRHIGYAQKVAEEMMEGGVRVSVDDRSESVGRKIREAEMQKIPFMLIVGDKEIAESKVALRKYGEGDKGKMEVDKLLKILKSPK